MKITYFIIFGIVVLFSPLLMAWGLNCEWFSFAKGQDNAWIGFWGSYLGGLVSGIITFGGVYFGFKLQKDENKLVEDKKKIVEIFKNYNDVFQVYDWCNQMVKYLDNTYTWESKRISDITDKANKSSNVFLEIDIDWYKDIQSMVRKDLLITINYELDKKGQLHPDVEKAKSEYGAEVEKMRNELHTYLRIKN